MRFKLQVAFGAAALALAGCVAAAEKAADPTATVVTGPVTPTTLDEASRQVARTAINTEMQNRLPGVNVAPYTDCVMANATTAELIGIAQASRTGATGVADSVAAIVSRPATGQCIAGAASRA